MLDALSTALIVEILATGASLLYIILLIRERIACWPFGIAMRKRGRIGSAICMAAGPMRCLCFTRWVG